MPPAKLYSLVYRASEWHVIYRHYVKGGSYLYEAFVFDYDRGLTEDEAYHLVQFPGSPQRYECILTSLNPWPYIETPIAHVPA